MEAQAALSRRGVAVLIVPIDVSKAAAPDELAFSAHRAAAVLRPSDSEFDRIAEIVNAGKKVAIYGSPGCQGAHNGIVALAESLRARVAHTSRAKDLLAYDNPFNVGTTGIFATSSGHRALMNYNNLLLLGRDFAWR